MNYFLAKTDPQTYSIEDLEREERSLSSGHSCGKRPRGSGRRTLVNHPAHRAMHAQGAYNFRTAVIV